MILVATGDDVVGAAFCSVANMLRLEVAAMRCSVAVNEYFVIADQMLAVVKVLERFADASGDCVDTGECRGLAKLCRGVVEKYRSQSRPIFRVECLAVPKRDGDDVAFVEEFLQRCLDVNGCAHTNVHPPSTAMF